MGYIPAKFAALSCVFQLDWNWGSYSFPNFSSLGRLLCIEDIAELPKFLLIAKPGWPDGQSEVRCGPPETNGRFLRIEIPSGHIQIFGSPQGPIQCKHLWHLKYNDEKPCMQQKWGSGCKERRGSWWWTSRQARRLMRRCPRWHLLVSVDPSRMLPDPSKSI